MMKFRDLNEEDRQDIEDIARGTWEGEDYLPMVFDEWLREGNFYGIEKEGKIIATGKITILPDFVGWLEGLRVHPDYRGRGYGRRMHEYLLKKSEELSKRGDIRTLEYATYFRNEGSIYLGLKTGFDIVKKYYGMEYESSQSKKPQASQLESIDELVSYEEYIPCGWIFIHKAHDALDYLREKCMVFSYEGHKFLVLKEHSEEVIPLELKVDILKRILPGIAYHSPEGRISIIVPDNWDYKIYESLGFRKWENVTEPEIWIFRKKF